MMKRELFKSCLFSLPLSFLFQNRTTIIGRIDLIQSQASYKLPYKHHKFKSVHSSAKCKLLNLQPQIKQYRDKTLEQQYQQ